MTDAAVQAWYDAKQPWGPEGKTAEWAEIILLEGGALFEGRDVLNLGCFYPEDELRFHGRAKSWAAIDFTPSVIDRCRALDLPRVRFLVMDMRALAFEDASFDVVLDHSSGDHLARPDFETMLREAARVLRPGGVFVIAFANLEPLRALYPEWKNKVDDVREYGYWRAETIEAMTAVLERAGLAVERIVNRGEVRAGMLARKTPLQR